MIIYLDSSAIVKRYVSEPGTRETRALIREATLVGTCEVSRAEVSAAFTKAIRVRTLAQANAVRARTSFHTDWPSLVRIQLTEAVTARADELAWTLGLRGYDAVQLASATTWKEAMQADIVLATYDTRLWDAARERGFTVFPGSIARS